MGERQRPNVMGTLYMKWSENDSDAAEDSATRPKESEPEPTVDNLKAELVELTKLKLHFEHESTVNRAQLRLAEQEVQQLKFQVEALSTLRFGDEGGDAQEQIAMLRSQLAEALARINHERERFESELDRAEGEINMLQSDVEDFRKAAQGRTNDNDSTQLIFAKSELCHFKKNFEVILCV